jgi:hypothetical protein
MEISYMPLSSPAPHWLRAQEGDEPVYWDENKFVAITKSGREHVFPHGYTVYFEVGPNQFDLKRLSIFVDLGKTTPHGTPIGDYEDLPYSMVKKVWKKMNDGLETPLCGLVPENAFLKPICDCEECKELLDSAPNAEERQKRREWLEDLYERENGVCREDPDYEEDLDA